jgi:transcriptional regulator with XRE-family HTH domain
MTLEQLRQRLVDVTATRVTPSHLSEIERDKNSPSLELATKLSRATDGEVKVEEFVRSQ